MLWLLGLIGTINASAQSFYFRHYQVENGLSNNAVICSVQDKKGFLWFGTKDGLDRFDGYRFKIFRSDPDDSTSIGNNFIHSLYIDLHDSLWVGTDKGLYKYHAASESFSILPTPFTEQVTDIKMDIYGNLWFISNFNLFRYREMDQHLEQFPIPDYFEATSICPLPDGSVWASTSSGKLEKYDSASHHFLSYDVFNHSPATVSNWIERLYATRQGDLLIGTSNQGVKLFSTHDLTYRDILTYNSDKTEIFARNFLQTGEDEFWIATESGIFVYNMKTRRVVNLHKEYNNPYSISDNAVYTFCRDQEGGIWAGTYFGGVNYYARQPLAFTKYFPEEGRNSLSGNVVREIHQDQYGNLWIGTEDAGLNELNPHTGHFTSYLPTGRPGGISYTNIHGLLADGDKLWIGTFEHGLDIMNIPTGKVIRHYSKGTDSTSLRSNFIYCIYRDQGGTIMLGTTIGAYRYNPETDNFTQLPGMPLYNWYSSILEDEQGTIWATTYGNGIHYFNPHTMKGGNFQHERNNKQSLASDRVNSVFEDSKRRLWFATENGLCLLDRERQLFKRYSTSTGLPSNFILSLLEDDQHRLWISTSKGLVCLIPETNHITVYSRANGLLNDQFNFNSSFRDEKGRLYFGSVKGMISFDPDQLQSSDFVPIVYITAIQVNNRELLINKKGSPLKQSITYTHRLDLNYRQSTFSIDFASLSYTAPEMTRYAYRMDGLTEDWTYLNTDQKVYFTQLKPGHYSFVVKAAINNENWDGPETILEINIAPPWWASYPAYAIYALLGALGIFWLFHNYHQRVKEKHRHRMEQLEIAKEKELYEAKLQFFTNVAHEIKTPLTLIVGPLEKVIRRAGHQPEIRDSLRIMEKNTDRLVSLSNQLLDFRQTEIKGFSLNFTRANICELIDDAFLSFKPLAEQKKIQFSKGAMPPELFANIDIEAFNKILSNLLSNALKYADRRVEVVLLPVQPGDCHFTLEIRNDGFLIPYVMKDKIFEPFFRLKETGKEKGTGIGLALSRSLAQLQNGILDLKEPDEDMNIFYIQFPIYPNQS